MEVVLLLLGIVGIALVVVPRIQRRSRSGRGAPRSRRAPVAKRGRTAPATASPAVATWTPAGPADDEDGWDDDLGWEGVETPAPEAREAWRRWRVTESPLASEEPEDAPVEPVAELPSVERWRTKAQEEEDWLEDDDGLGWEGEDAGSTLWNGNGDAPGGAHDGGHPPAHAHDGHQPAPTPVANGRLPAPAPAHDGHEPAPAPVANGQLPATGGWTSGRDWTRKPEPAPTDPAVPAASAATDVAPDAELGRTFALEDDGWDDEPVGRQWGASAEDAPPAKPPPAPRGKRKLHPVLLLAIYAAAGIGLVVLASTAVLGGSTDRAPADPAATRSTPEPVGTPQPTPEATGSVADDPAALEAARAAEAKAGREFRRERTRALGARGEAVDRARAAARRKERAAERERERRRERQSRNSGSGSNTPAPPANPSPPVSTPPPASNPAPPQQRRSRPVCEFCIG